MECCRISAVQRACNHAVEDQLLGRSPIARIRKPFQGMRENVVNHEIFQETLEHVRSEGFKDLLTAACETGARPQELLAVEASNVDLENRRWLFEVKASKGKRKVA